MSKQSEKQIPLFRTSSIPLVESKSSNKQKKEDILKRRVRAFSFDLFAIIFISKGLSYSYYQFLNPFLFQLPRKVQTSFLHQHNDFSFIISALTCVTYFFTFLSITHGQTPGKIFFDLRVYSPKKGPLGPSLAQNFMRSISYFFCLYTGFFLLALPFMTKSKKGIPDFLSATKVSCDKEYFHWLRKMHLYENAKEEWEATQQKFNFNDISNILPLNPNSENKNTKKAA